jgi:hypothetical protein
MLLAITTQFLQSRNTVSIYVRELDVDPIFIPVENPAIRQFLITVPLTVVPDIAVPVHAAT